MEEKVESYEDQSLCDQLEDVNGIWWMVKEERELREGEHENG